MNWIFELKYWLGFIFILIIFSLNGCKNKIQPIDQYEEFVFGVQLVDDSLMVEKYIDYHRNVWPEVKEGFKKAGYEQIRLFRYGTFVTMIIKVPIDSDLASMSQISNDSHPKVNEWNNLMNKFQKGLRGTRSGQTWVEMKNIFEFQKVE